MRDIIEAVHVIRDGRFWRCSVAEVRFLGHPERGGKVQDPKRQQVGRQAHDEREPKAGPIPPTERERAP